MTPLQSDQSWNRECTGTGDSPKEALDPCRHIREAFLEEEMTFWLRREEVRVLTGRGSCLMRI